MDNPTCRVCNSTIAPEAQKYLFVTDNDFRPIHPTCLIQKQSDEIDALRAELARWESDETKQTLSALLADALTERDVLRADLAAMTESRNMYLELYKAICFPLTNPQSPYTNGGA